MAEPVHDPKVLRAIAHPVRNRILGELVAAGPMRAADVARELGIPANQASFHLRQLAKYGLVEEDPEAARDKRDRVWRTVNDDGLNVDVGDLEQQPGGRAAAQIFMRNAASWAHLAVDRAYSGDRDPDTTRATLDQALRLTKDEGRELTDDLAALLKKWTERTRGRSEQRTTYLVHMMVLPYPELPTDDSDPASDAGSRT